LTDWLRTGNVLKREIVHKRNGKSGHSDGKKTADYEKERVKSFTKLLISKGEGPFITYSRRQKREKRTDSKKKSQERTKSKK